MTSPGLTLLSRPLALFSFQESGAPAEPRRRVGLPEGRRLQSGVQWWSQEIGMQGMDAGSQNLAASQAPTWVEGVSLQNPDVVDLNATASMLVWALVSPLPQGKGFRSFEEVLSTQTCLLTHLLKETAPDQPPAPFPPALPKNGSHSSKSCCYLIAYYVPGTGLGASIFISISFNNLRKEVVLYPFY